MSTVADTLAPAVTPRSSIRRDLGGHAVVAGGQLASGAANLVFAVLAARVLVPAGFADLAAFLALYLLLHLPATGLTAGAALDPAGLAHRRRTAALVGVGAGAVLAVAAPALATQLRLPVPLLLALAAAAPGAALLGIERGRLYGDERRLAVAGTLLAEPGVRIALGLPLLAVAGTTGAAAGVVAAGYAALAVAALANRDRLASAVRAAGDGSRAGRTGRQAGMAVVVFLLLAVVQNQDLVLAQRLLPDGDAGRFAILSTIGGAAAFATATVPLVLLPAAAQRRRHSLSLALAVAAALGAAVVLAGALAPHDAVARVFGDDYAPVARLVPVYLVAMAALGLARVVVAHRLATGRGRSTAVLVGLVGALQAVLLVTVADTVGRVVAVSLGALALLAVTVAVPEVIPLDALRARAAAVRRAARRPVWRWVALATLVGLLVRLLLPRGIWVDEAISITQAQQPVGEMLRGLARTDVHPPLHHLVLWVTVRTLGTSELAVRLPSILAGAALIPALFVTGRALYDRRTGLLAAALAVPAPFLVWYSQEARMYSLFMLFSVLAVWAQVQAVQRGKVRDWAAFAVATAAMCWTQYFALFPILVQQLAFAGIVWSRRHDRAERRRLLAGWAATTVVVAVLVAPLLPILTDQVHAYQLRSSGRGGQLPAQAGNAVAADSSPSVYAVLANLVWAGWGYHDDDAMARVVALWPLLMLLTLAGLGRGRRRASLLVAALVVVPLAGLFALGVQKRDLFELRYAAGTAPLLVLLAARTATTVTRSTAALALAATLLFATMVGGLVDQQVNGANPRRYDFAGALHRIERTAEPGDVVLYAPDYLYDVVHYYAPDMEMSRLDGRVDRDQGVYVVATERVANPEATAAAVGARLAELREDREVVRRFEVSNVKVWELR